MLIERMVRGQVELGSALFTRPMKHCALLSENFMVQETGNIALPYAARALGLHPLACLPCAANFMRLFPAQKDAIRDVKIESYKLLGQFLFMEHSVPANAYSYGNN
jgi:hypothetical protein